MDAETMVQRWPFEVGKGPFRIKGTALKGAIQRLDTSVPGGLKVLLQAVANPALERLVTAQVLPSSMYDCYALALLNYHASRLLGRSLADHVRDSATAQFNADLNGIYKAVLRIVSARTAIERVTRVIGSYYDFAPATLRQVSDRGAELARAGFPELLTPWWGPVAEGYAVAALAATGAKNIRYTLVADPTHNKAHGVALVDMRMTVTWE